MTDRDALLAAILREPADDTARLVFADWLDEHGEPDRAEFIRVQCELARTPEDVRVNRDNRYHREAAQYRARRDREWELFRGRHFGWWPDLQSWVVRCKGDPVEPAWPLVAEVARGFVEAALMPAAVFVGGPCDNCDGTGTVENGAGHPGPCPDCGGQFEPREDWIDPGYSPGTGRTPGLAAALFAAHPIERVTLTDREPVNWGNARWFWGHESNYGNDHAPESSLISDCLFWKMVEAGAQYIDDPDERLRWVYFDTRDAALAALSDACVRYGRGRGRVARPWEGRGKADTINPRIPWTP